MNRKIVVLLVICLCLLAACATLDKGGNILSPPPEPDTTPESEYEKPVYQLEPSYLADKQYYANGNSGDELAHYTYQLDALSITNLEQVSPEDAEAAQRNIAAFNNKMSGLLDDLVAFGKAMGDDAATLYVQESTVFTYGGFYDETTSACYQAGDVVSVRLDTSSYAGGAHPNYYTSGYLFDLRTGQFIDATQLAEDPEAFRSGVAELLVEKADAIEDNRDGYWPDYTDILSRWNEGAVLFDGEGMLVVYSPYDIGPYAMGMVELRLSYDELAEVIGQSGAEHLGIQTG